MAEPNPTLAQNGNQPSFFGMLFGGAGEQAPAQAAPAKLSRHAASAQMKAQAAKAATPAAPQYITDSNGRVREAHEWEKTPQTTGSIPKGKQQKQARAPNTETPERAPDSGRGSGFSFGSSGRLGAPVRGGSASSEFGARERPEIRNKAGKVIAHGSERHAGLDIAAPTGTPVYAAGDGVVGVAGKSGGYGNLVEIEHSGGVETRYGHLSGYAKGLRPGMPVHEGDLIGYVGSTGNSTGPHLHYEVRQNGTPVNPRTMTAGLPGGNDRTMVADAGRDDARPNRTPQQKTGRGNAAAMRPQQVARADDVGRNEGSGRPLSPDEMNALAERARAAEQAAAAPGKKPGGGSHYRKHNHGTRLASVKRGGFTPG